MYDTRILHICCCRSVAQSCPTLCNPMDCSTPGLPVHHQLPGFAQTHVHWVDDAIQPSHPLSSPSPPAFSLSQHQGLFRWVSSQLLASPFVHNRFIPRCRSSEVLWTCCSGLVYQTQQVLRLGACHYSLFFMVHQFGNYRVSASFLPGGFSVKICPHDPQQPVLSKTSFVYQKEHFCSGSQYLFFLVKVAQSCLTLCDPMDYTVLGILQARILEWEASPFSMGSSQPRDETQVSRIAGGFFTSWATREAQEYWRG